jgi:hypothetical protein
MSNPPTIPQSPHGGTAPELRARITTATAVVKDFTRDTSNWIAGKGEQPYWQEYAWRLHTELRSLLQLLDGRKEATPS